MFKNLGKIGDGFTDWLTDRWRLTVKDWTFLWRTVTDINKIFEIFSANETLIHWKQLIYCFKYVWLFTKKVLKNPGLFTPGFLNSVLFTPWVYNCASLDISPPDFFFHHEKKFHEDRSKTKICVKNWIEFRGSSRYFETQKDSSYRFSLKLEMTREVLISSTYNLYTLYISYNRCLLLCFCL